jgi:hypothetical protein
MRRLYYRDSYGRVRRGRLAGLGISGGSGTPVRFFVTVLMVLAGIVVIASLIRLPAYSISGGGPRPGGPRHCGDHRRAAGGGGREGGYRPVTKALAPGQPGNMPGARMASPLPG